MAIKDTKESYSYQAQRELDKIAELLDRCQDTATSLLSNSNIDLRRIGCNLLESVMLRRERVVELLSGLEYTEARR